MPGMTTFLTKSSVLRRLCRIGFKLRVTVSDSLEEAPCSHVGLMLILMT
uniref:Putative methyltransferase PMT17 n=1 Tax=Rhizophora mucronata TaxID=61149 RepID=A0A2P2Q7I7_RHIMU